jgi:hypothetical protein
MITGTLFQFFSNGLGRWLGTAAVLGVALLSWRVTDVAKQRAIGAERVVAKVEKANTDAIRKARAARAAAQQPKPNGLRDPNTITD